MSRRFLLAALALALTAGPAAATDPGTAGANFLTIEQGARPLGMGGAFSAMADDANALWWNPAGLARSPFSEVTLTHTVYLDNVATDYVGFVRPYAPVHGTLGASLLYLSVPGIDGTDALGNPTGSLKSNGYIATVSYGLAVSSGLTVGVTGKYISQNLGGTSGSGVAADIGAQYWADDYGAAVVIQNLGPSFKIGDTSDPLPRDLRVGAFYKPRKTLILAFDEEKPYNDTARAHLGGEWLATQVFRLRAGFQQVPNVSGAGFTVGLGLAGAFGGGLKSEQSEEADSFKPFWERMSPAGGDDFKTAVRKGAYILGLDYAFVSYGSSLSDVHRITLTARF
jgi:hypothetical protein